MPSPLGHLVAGAAIGWVAEALPPLREHARSARGGNGAVRTVTPLVSACAVLALAPDLDILLGSHRTYTHSVAAVGLAALIGGAIARTRRAPALATGLACGLAVGSHIVFDWLGRDTSTPAGLLALWPIATSYAYSGIDLFAEISRRYWKPDEFIVKNAISMARELLILGPPAALAWWARQRQISGEDGAAGSTTSAVARRGAARESRIPDPESRR
jgi:hypothetical protein